MGQQHHKCQLQIFHEFLHAFACACKWVIWLYMMTLQSKLIWPTNDCFVTNFEIDYLIDSDIDSAYTQQKHIEHTSNYDDIKCDAERIHWYTCIQCNEIERTFDINFYPFEFSCSCRFHSQLKSYPSNGKSSKTITVHTIYRCTRKRLLCLQ